MVLRSLSQYAVFAAVALLGSGAGLQRILCRRIDPALVVPVGTAWAALWYWLSLVLQQPTLFPAGAIAACLGLALSPTRPWLASGPSIRGALPASVAIVAVLAVTQFGGNRVGPAGEFLLDPFLAPDTAFHVGLSRELSFTYPPQVPGVSGYPLGYHLGPDLVRAAALRWAELDPFDAIARYDVTLGALALLLVLRGATRSAGGSRLAVALVPWTLLATDFSFLFGTNPQAHWWADLLRGNLLISLALANPIIPALTLALGCLVALRRFEAGEGSGWLVVAAGLGAAVPFFKVFLGAHLVLGLAAAASLPRNASPRAHGFVALSCLTGTALLALGQGGTTVEVTLAPLDLVRTTRDTLGLPGLGGSVLGAWSVLWVVASLGLRVLGLSAAWRALRAGPPLATALAAMALAAWPLGLLFRVSAPQVLVGQKVVNDSAYLIEQGGPLLWIFTAMALAAWTSTRGRVLIAGLAALLAVPSTVQFVAKKASMPWDPVPAPVIRAMKALEAQSRPGDVVLQRPGARYPPLPVILVGLRVPYERFTPYLTQFVAREDLERRHETVYRFFHTTDRAEAETIARSLGASFVCLYGPDRIRFDASGLLDPIHEEPQARVYRVRGSVVPEAGDR